MNIPMSWLKSFVDIDCDTQTFCDRMTMSGSKVEAVHRFGEGVSNIVVGKILSVEKHRQADKLVVCQVEVGGGEHVQIVTGADNVFPGAFVPVALVGSTVIGGVKIKKGNLRGEFSNGMMCSIEELGYTLADYPEAAEDGIYIFQEPDKLTLGEDALPILEISEDVVEFEITSNRTDCFSVVGIAREAAATFGKPLKLPEVTVSEKAAGHAKDYVSIEILNPELCPRYMARVVKNVKIGPSPQWLRHRLTTAGLRPINNIVDITNYVMLEYGQPMHAFDIGCVAKAADGTHKIIVRNARDGETFTTLDGTARKLDQDMLVIADSDKAIALAGVMGGENSKVSENAGAILFESANFNGPNIRHTSKKLGLRTDASTKYEKGIDPNLAAVCVNRAAQLVELLGCGEVVPGAVDAYPVVREPWLVAYDPANINRLLGTSLSAEDMADMLASAGIQAENNVAAIPTFRPDITMEADIAEEVARFYGYDKLETTLAAGTPTVGRKSSRQNTEDLIKNTLVSLGLFEALHYSFESPKVFDKLSLAEDDPLRQAIAIRNPLGEDFSIMRTQTAAAMLQSLGNNYNRRNPEAALFEFAKVYVPKGLPLSELPDEKETVTIGFYGKRDFFDLKGMAQQLFSVLGIGGIDYEQTKDIPFMHPGRTARIMTSKGAAIGYLGEVHPAVAARFDIETKAYLAAIDADFLCLNASLVKTFVPLPKFPGVTRDIAMLVKDDVPVKQIELAIIARGGKILKTCELFDVYKGKQVEEGYKSVAYTLTFRADDKTLTDDDVNKVMRKIVDNLEIMVGAKLRG